MLRDKKSNILCWWKTRRTLLYGDKTRDKMEMVTSTGGESLSPAAECMARVVGSRRGRPGGDDDGDDGVNGNGGDDDSDDDANGKGDDGVGDDDGGDDCGGGYGTPW